jgi:hypothetical protein
MKLRERKEESEKRTGAGLGASNEPASPQVNTGRLALHSRQPTDVDQRIAEMKQRRASAPRDLAGFAYDPDEPLRLVKPGKSGMER